MAQLCRKSSSKEQVSNNPLLSLFFFFLAIHAVQDSWLSEIRNQQHRHQMQMHAVSAAKGIYLYQVCSYPSFTEDPPTSMVSIGTNSTCTNFSAIGVKFVLVEFLISKFVLVEFSLCTYYSSSTNFAQYNFLQVPKIVLSEDPLYTIFPHIRPTGNFFYKAFNCGYYQNAGIIQGRGLF